MLIAISLLLALAHSSGGVPGVQMEAGISVQLLGGSNRLERFVWGLLVQTEAGWLYPVPGRVHVKEKAESVLTDQQSQTQCKFEKKLPKLRTAIALIGWTIRIHKCGYFYWTQVRKFLLP